MANEKQVQLVQRLIERTMAGAVRWEPTADGEVFQAAFPNYGVRIERLMDQWRDHVTGYAMFVLNGEGVAVDELRDENFTEIDFGRSPFMALQDLFMGARRTALGADAALDSILNDLEG
jgi:hypothetical protein